MPWEPPWSRMNPRDLPAYVDDAAATYLNEKSPGWQTAHHDLAVERGRHAVVQSIYETLCGTGVHYAAPPPPRDPSDDVTQEIRLPSEVLLSVQVGTCLDLATLFCGLCTASHLLPLIVVLEGHALVGVSLSNSSHEWDLPERSMYEPDWNTELDDVSKLTKLVDDGRYVLIECTGFAYSTSLSETLPEGRLRRAGLLTFERAREAAREQLERSERPLLYAIDIATARGKWKIMPGQRTSARSGLAEREQARQRNKPDIEQAHARHQQRVVASRERRGLRHVGAELPDLGDDLFRDRVEPAGRVRSLLTEPTASLICIVGRAGVGKSTLLGRTLRSIIAQPDSEIRSVVTLSARDDRGISVIQLCESVTKALATPEAKSFERRWRAYGADQRSRTTALIDVLSEHRFVVVWDNVEMLLDHDGKLAEEGIRTFLESFLMAPRQTRLVMASREPIQLEARFRRLATEVEVPSALPPHDAIALLRDLDANGESGVADADPEVIQRLLRVTDSRPWALIRVMDLRLENPFTHMSELVDRLELDPDPLLELARETVSRLAADARVVACAMAVFAGPVELAAVRYVLEELSPTIRVEAVAATLIRRRIVRFDRDRKTLQLHRLDQAAALDALSARTAYPQRRDFELRAAQWYGSLCRPLVSAPVAAEMEPYERRFYHLVSAGEVDAASASLREIEGKHVIFGGWAHSVLLMRGHLTDVPLTPLETVRQHLVLGMCHRVLGPYSTARTHLKAAVRLGRTVIDGETDESRSERLLLTRRAQGWLGELQKILGDLPRARRNLAAVSEDSRAQGDLEDELWAEGELVLLDCYDGDPAAGIARCQDGLRTAEDADDTVVGIAHAIGLLHDGACLAHLLRGELTEAEHHAGEALRRYRYTGEQYLEGYAFNMLGMVSIERFEVTRAIEQFSRAIECAAADSYERVAGLAGHNLALAHVMAGNGERAAATADEAIAAWERLGPSPADGVPEHTETVLLQQAVTAWVAGDRSTFLQEVQRINSEALPDLISAAIVLRWLDTQADDDSTGRATQDGSRRTPS